MAPEKTVVFLGDSREVLQGFSKAVRAKFGLDLYRIQCGLLPADSKKLRGFVPTVREIRVRHDKEAYRAIYTVELGDVIYLLHVFHKKSSLGIETPTRELDLVRQRLAEAVKRERNR